MPLQVEPCETVVVKEGHLIIVSAVSSTPRAVLSIQISSTFDSLTLLPVESFILESSGFSRGIMQRSWTPHRRQALERTEQHHNFLGETAYCVPVSEDYVFVNV